MSEVHLPDPGPLARFKALIEKPETMGVIAQRLMEGETLKAVAQAWEVPYGRLAQWVTEDADRAEQYARASRIWADALARETVAIADALKGDGLTKSEIAAARVKIGVREHISSKLDRERYGDRTEVKVEGPALPPGDRETLILETARAFALIMASGADIAAGRTPEPRILPALPEPEHAEQPLEQEPPI